MSFSKYEEVVYEILAVRGKGRRIFVYKEEGRDFILGVVMLCHARIMMREKGGMITAESTGG